MKTQLNIRIDTKDFMLTKKVAKKRGEGLTDFVRRAIKVELARLGFLTEGERKALGVKL